MWPGTLKGRSGRDLVWKLILRQENMGSTGDRVKNKKKKKLKIYLIQTKMIIIKKQVTINIGEDVRERVHSYFVGGTEN